MYDAVIIGSGPGGYHCAARIAELGGKVAIVEKEKIGGTCTNCGCIPTKAMHASAKLFADINNARKLGINVSDASVDFKTVMSRKDRVSKIMSMGVERILKDKEVKIIQGEGVILDKNTVIVGDNKIETKNIVIATGAKPNLLGFKLGENVLSSKEILTLEELPESLIVIGGGYIGCEFASIFASLGSKVTVIEMLDNIVATEDSEISVELQKLMERKGITVMTGTKVGSIKGNKVLVSYQEKEEKELVADKILLSLGVLPNFNKEELEKLGIKYEKGIIVNDKMQTSIENIYAIGDVTNDNIKLAHYAYAHADVAAVNIMGSDAKFDESLIPSSIFTIPEIASVGEKNSEMKSAVFSFAANGKARSMEKGEGFVKIYHQDGMLKGFCAIGPHVSDLVAEAALAIKNKISLKQISATIHAHPTLPEAFLEVVRIALKEE